MFCLEEQGEHTTPPPSREITNSCEFSWYFQEKNAPNSQKCLVFANRLATFFDLICLGRLQMLHVQPCFSKERRGSSKQLRAKILKHIFSHSWSFSSSQLGVSQRPLTLILLQKHRDTNGRRIVIQIGGVHTTFCQEEGILLQKYRDRNVRWVAIFFKSIGVRGRLDSPE